MAVRKWRIFFAKWLLDCYSEPNLNSAFFSFLRKGDLQCFEKDCLYEEHCTIVCPYNYEFRIEWIHCVKKSLLHNLITWGMFKSEILVRILVRLQKFHSQSRFSRLRPTGFWNHQPMTCSMSTMTLSTILSPMFTRLLLTHDNFGTKNAFHFIFRIQMFRLNS